MSHPQLTTVHQQFVQQGVTAIELAREMTAGGEPRIVVLTPEVVVRAST